VALVGHATGEWEEGGEGVQGGGRGHGYRKFQELGDERGEAYKRAQLYMYIYCRLYKRRSTLHIRMDWGYTILYPI
jgi:hypothetical protein